MIGASVKAVSFDVNGTLIHSPRLGEIYAEVLARHGMETDPETVHQTLRLVWQEFSCHLGMGEDRFSTHPGGVEGWWFRFVDRVCEHLELGTPTVFAKKELLDRFAQADAWEVYDEAPEVLAELQQRGIRMIVLSNWDDRLPILLERLELAPFFEAVIYSAAVGAEKPFAPIFEAALMYLAVPTGQVLHVGDRLREDVEGAQALGMQAVHLERQAGASDSSDVRVIKDLRAVVELVAQR